MTLPFLYSLIPSTAPLNSTLTHHITPHVLNAPIYHTSSPSLISFISDKHLSLALPILVYWLLSLVFHHIDTAGYPYFEKRRIHESPEVLSRNKATVRQVVEAVLVQQVFQTLLGWAWLESEEVILRREVWINHLAIMQESYVGPVAKTVLVVLGKRTGEQLLMDRGQALVTWAYWWGVPILQMAFAFFVIDTHQYFLHRLFHTVPFLYRHFHSVHHRLYVPYAFGALYNHPVEGLLLDTLGAAIAHWAAGMSVRQAVVLFGVSTWKTVDDHCGYRLEWDPCQWLTSNNVDYHDLHHQSWGIKKNFSQPFFTNWDILLNTRMTRDQVPERFRLKSKIS